MDVTIAVDLVNSLIYKPGWRISATDHTNRFEGAIKVRIDYPAENTNRDKAIEGYTEHIDTYAQFPMYVVDCDRLGVLRRVLQGIMRIEEHESREYFRTQPEYDAPFHPHKREGSLAWGVEPADDLHFGIA
jgi:hypothetical protein